MKSTPILMNAPMVRATLNGTKRQTRRIVKSPARNMQSEGMEVIKHRSQGDPWYKDYVWSMRGKTGVWADYKHDDFMALCPYGSPGDELWVRETWGQSNGYMTPEGVYEYRANLDDDDVAHAARYNLFKWKPSIHMPRAASRITLRIKDVRVERLQDISEEDAIAEGIERVSSIGPMRAFGWKCYEGSDGHMDPVRSFASLWRSINGQGSWALNPWVWNLAFERIEP